MLKISIITICFNNEQDIRATIESVVNQTYNDIEYIIKDGGSKDKTLEIVNEYKDKITKIISVPDHGLYDAINQGIQTATGDVVGMIHAGDRLNNPEVVAKIASFFENNEVDVMYGNSEIVDENGVLRRVNISPEYKRKNIRNGWEPSHQSIYAKRSLFEKYGYYKQEIGPDADYEWIIRYFYKYGEEIKVKRLNEYIITFTLGGQSSSNYKKLIDKEHREMLKNCWRSNGLKPPFAIVYRKWMTKIPMYARAYFRNLFRKNHE